MAESPGRGQDGAVPALRGRRGQRGHTVGTDGGADRNGARRARRARPSDPFRAGPVSPATLRRAALVVDDDATGREHTCELLNRVGFAAVDRAGDGREALERIGSGRYGLLVCDLSMPGMDGVELMRHLAARRFGAPVVLTSASNERLLAAAIGQGRAQGLAVAGGLRKPLNRVSLHRVLVAAGVLSPPPAPVGGDDLGVEALREALDAPGADGGVVAWFQPILRVADGVTIGAEARPHWDHPTRGVLAGDVLAPAAERAGLSGRLTERMLVQALAFRRTAPERATLAMSVDLSGEDLQDFGVVDRLHGLVDACGAAPESIVFEVSESRLVEDSATAVEVLTRLRMRGFELAIDDFGTGWSSLALLAQIPFGRMKIDARFVLSAPNDDTAMGIVESSVHLGRRLGMTIVADGIETQAHWDLCARFGIDGAQGWMLGRAAPPEAFARRYQRA